MLSKICRSNFKNNNENVDLYYGTNNLKLFKMKNAVLFYSPFRNMWMFQGFS